MSKRSVEYDAWGDMGLGFGTGRMAGGGWVEKTDRDGRHY